MTEDISIAQAATTLNYSLTYLIAIMTVLGIAITVVAFLGARNYIDFQVEKTLESRMDTLLKRDISDKLHQFSMPHINVLNYGQILIDSYKDKLSLDSAGYFTKVNRLTATVQGLIADTADGNLTANIRYYISNFSDPQEDILQSVARHINNFTTALLERELNNLVNVRRLNENQDKDKTYIENIRALKELRQAALLAMR